MAEINTTINLRDGMSQPLRHMIKAMNVLVSTVQSVASKTKSPIDHKALMTARSELARASSLLNEMGTGATNTSAKVKQVASTTSELTSKQERAILQQDRLTRSANDTVRSEERLKKAVSDTFAAEQRALTASERMKQSLTQTSIKQQQLAKATHQTWQAQEKTKQAIEGTSQSVLKTKNLQETLNNSILRGQNIQQRKKLAEEQTNNARLRGINLELQGENIKKRGAALDEAAANRAARKVAQEEKVRQKLLEQERVKKVIALTETFHANEVAKVTREYEEANQKVLKLELSTKRYTQAGAYGLKNAREIASLRQKILNDTNKLVSVRARLNVLEIQGKSTGLQALIAKRQERSLKEQIARSSSKIVSIERQLPPIIRQATAAQKQHNAAIQQGASSSGMLWSKMKGLAGAYLGIQTVGSIVKTSDALAANEARLNLMVKEGETVQQVSDQIYAAAMRSRSGYLAMSDSVAKLGIQAGNLFDNSGDMIRFMETFNKMGVISKANAQQTNAAMTQLIQALSFGQLRGDELKSILENMPMVAQVLADELTRMGDGFFDTLPDKLKHIADDGKVTADEIRALGYEGQIASDTVVNAMLNGSKKVDKMAKDMTWTWSQVWEVFKNSAMRAFTPVLRGISKIIQTDRFKRFATWVDKAMSRVANAINGLWETAGPVIAKIFDGVAKIGNFIADNWSLIQPVIWGIVGALTAMKIITWGTAIVTGALTAAKVVATFFTWAFRKATLAQAGAQWGLNAAMYACPTTWIIIAIIAIIVLIYLVVAAINKLCGTTYSATGFIVGCIFVIGDVIWNFIVGVWDGIAILIEYIVNVWQHPVFAVKQAWANMALLVIDGFIAMTDGCDEFCSNFAAAIVEAINIALKAWNAFVDILPSTVTSFIGIEKADMVTGKFSSGTDALKALRDKITTGVGEKPDDYWTAPKLEYRSWLKDYKKGYNWGKGVADKFDGLMSGASLDELKKLGDLSKKVEQGDFSKALEGGYDDPTTANGAKDVRNPALDKIGKNTDKIADSTGQTAENTSQNDEYFKYLRRAGERHSMNRQQLLNFKVDMSNVNHIKSGLDYDEMMKRLAQELYRQVVGKMNGVAY